MIYEAKGTLNKKFDTQHISDNFKKREFVLDITDNQYTEYVKFQLMQDRCDLIDSINEGAEVAIKFVLKGKPYESKKTGETLYFTNLNVLAVQADSASSSDHYDSEPQNESFDQSNDDQDDLPF